MKRTIALLSLLVLWPGAMARPFEQEMMSTFPAATPPIQVSASYQGDPVSLKLVDVSLVDFFRTISELSGLNILIDPDVQGTVTINVEEVPWDQLFEAVLRSQGLQRSIEGNLVRISTRQTLRTEEEQALALKQAAFLAKDTVTITHHLNYASGKDLIPALEEQLSPRGQLNVDERTNMVIITDVPESAEKLTSLLNTLDIAEKQVEIEARIIEATTNFARELGAQFGLVVGKTTDRNHGALTALAPAGEPVGVVEFISGKLMDTVKLDALITAAERQGEARVLSKPRVSAQNNAEAIITQGSKIPIPVQQNFTTTVRFETAALRLTVTPQITDEDTVALNIRVENNIPDFTRTVLGIPTILTSESQTRVLVVDGGTTVIGGIFVEIDRMSQDKIPGLGDIPLLGNLFKRDNKERETREILFFITPRIKR